MKAEKNTNFNKLKNATTRGSFFATSRFFISFILIFCMLFSLCGCSGSSNKQTKTAVYSFGDVSITAYGMSEADFESMQEEIIDIANLFEATVSLSSLDSELSRANAETSVKISIGIEKQIQMAIEYHDITYGTFNILLSPVVSAWGFLPGEENYLAGEIPTAETLEVLKDKIDISKIAVENGILTKPEDYTIDLGGISKGYMADQMLEIMQSYNCDGILSVGGIVVACGDKMGEGYQVAITNPTGGSYFDIISISDAVLVTSGNYERYFEVDGEIYCHIINPETLSPTTSDVVAVSVLSNSGADADVFATALMILDSEKREQLIKENEISCLIIYENSESETFNNFPTAG